MPMNICVRNSTNTFESLSNSGLIRSTPYFPLIGFGARQTLMIAEEKRGYLETPQLSDVICEQSLLSSIEHELIQFDPAG